MASNVPIQLTTFIGRERELRELRHLCETARLLTLVGAGGIGKTRLALQLAHELQREPACDAIWLIELAALGDPALVPQAVAASLDIRERPDQPLRETLREALRETRIVLLLDNCEHLIQACADLAEDLLRNCPHLRIVATSRQPLGLAGETCWRVPPLGLPPAHAGSGSDEVAAAESARLFVERARLALPTFVVTDRNARTLAEICRRLDGIPLAIELAAARMSALGIEQIEHRLADQFHLLGNAAQRGDPRHRTLRATVTWSHDLLAPVDQVVFRRLAVFAGGWTLEAAESVCADAGVAREDVLDHLARLVDQSLVQAEGQEGSARYRLLETLRQFAVEQLDGAAEGSLIRDRHRDWYLALAEQADADLNGPRQGEWLEVLDREQDNLRAGLQWSLSSGSIEQALAMAVACSYFWQIRGHRYRSEGRRWLEDAIAASESDRASPRARGRALYWAGTFAAEQFDFDTARARLQAALELWQSLDNERGVAEAQLGLATVYRDMAEYERAEELLRDSLARSRQLGDRLKVARVLRVLGNVALRRGDGNGAAAVLGESLEILQALGENHLVGHVWDHIGEAEQLRGQLQRALEAHRRGAELLEAAGCEEGVNTSLYLRARVAQRRDAPDQALTLAARSLRGYRVLGNRRDLPAGLELVAECLSRGDAERAAQLFGAADALRLSMRLPLPPAERASYERGVASLRQTLGHDAFEAAWAAGRALGRDSAIDLSIACAEKPSATRIPLTRRELDVALLVNRGLSNKEIANDLSVSVRTAEAHVTHVLNKLGLHSRSQLAVWVVEHGLLRAGEGSN